MTLLAALLVSAGLGGGCGSDEDATTPQDRPTWSVSRIPWDSSRFGGAVFRSDGKSVWLVSVGPADGSSNVWRVNASTGEATELALTRPMLEIVPRANQLWGIGVEGLLTTRPTLHSIDIEGSGSELREKELPRNGCGDLDAPVLFQGQLWLLCGTNGYVFGRDSREPLRKFAAPSARMLLAGTETLWSVGESELTALAGKSVGSRIPLPVEFEPWAEPSVAWAVEGDEAWAQGTADGGPAFLRVDLREQKARVVSIQSTVPGDIAIVGDEVWLTQSGDAAIDRYSRADPKTLLGRIEMPMKAHPEFTFNNVVYGSGSAWVSVTTEETLLFRITRS